jgi:membrane fusion protein (multidrug efflux system)
MYVEYHETTLIENFMHPVPSRLRRTQFPMNSTAAPPLRAGVLAALLGLSLLAACNKTVDQAHAAPGAMPPPQVSVVTVQPRTIETGYEYVGQTAGSRETEVRARISGILENRLYEEGSRVKAGAPLFQIDQGAYKTQLVSAEAAAGVAQAKYNQSQREFKRLAPLAAANAISQKEYDDARSAQETAEATLKQVQATVNEARLNLGYTKVVAPISGVTGIASKANGSLVTPTDSLLTTLVQTDPIYVNFSVPEADFLKLSGDVGSGRLSVPGKRAANGSLGFDVKLKLADGSMYPVTGKMNFSSEKVNAATGGFDGRAQIPNPDGKLRPGQFVRVALSGAQRTNAIAVPQRAVIDGPMGKMVFTVTPDNKLAPKPIELDGWVNGEWIVTKGLQSGERVLVDGFIKAHDPGMVVTPVALQTTAAPASGATTPAVVAAKSEPAR